MNSLCALIAAPNCRSLVLFLVENRSGFYRDNPLYRYILLVMESWSCFLYIFITVFIETLHCDYGYTYDDFIDIVL